jgi:hypothetical protein
MRVGLHLEVKFLQVTDIYANRRWFQWVTDHAEDYDLITYMGGFLDEYGPIPWGRK